MSMNPGSHSTKVCLDVQYTDTTAMVAGVVFESWSDEVPLQDLTITLPTPGEYVPGAFYKRELPCLLSLLERLTELPVAVIIDGYVWLGPDLPGLGAHLYRALKTQVPVIGVAKTFYQTQGRDVQVLRGQSQRPLYVTAAGMDPAEAAEHVRTMHGDHRIPALIKRADQLARGHVLSK